MPPIRPCPHCGVSNRVKPVRFTWWGGPIGPRLLSHVQCRRCGIAYNGKTGGSNTNGILAWTVVLATMMVVVLLVLAKDLPFR